MMSVALLRGINVGGRRKLPMAELKKLATGLGLTEVSTYIQSGNLMFESHDSVDVPARLSEAIRDRYDYDVSVIVRTLADLERIVSESPFRGFESDESHLHIGFLAEPPTQAAISGLARRSEPPEEFVVSGSELHLHLGLGMGKSKLMRYDFAKALGTEMTVRNWRSLNKLIELMSH